MHNFGDEFTIDSYRIPWLVWIQVMVMVLLFVLLYCFSLLILDLSDDNTSAATAKPSSSTCRLVSDDTNPLHKHTKTTTVFTSRLHNSRVGEIIKGETVTSTSRMVRGDDMVEMEVSGAAVPAHLYFHPCHYFRLARLAFLKCLGFDFASENSSTSQRGKRKEN